MGRLVGGSPGLSLRRQPLQTLGISLPLSSNGSLLMGADIYRRSLRHRAGGRQSEEGA